MRAQTRRYYIDTEGPDSDAMRDAFRWLLGIGEASNRTVSALLAIPVKANLRGVVAQVIGQGPTKALLPGKTVRLPNSSVELSLMTERAALMHWQGPVLAVYPTKRLLDMLDDMSGITEMLVVPWLRNDIQEWLETWSPTELRTSTRPRAESVRNPVVVNALKALTETVNLSTGITHPSDWDATVDLFIRLEGAGEDYDPKEVRAFLVSQCGWSPRDAGQVRSVAERVKAGRPPRFKTRVGRYWADDIVEQWRSRVGQ